MTEPEAAWADIAQRSPSALRTFCGFAVPIAVLPAAGWALRLQPMDLSARIEAFLMTCAFVLVTLVSVAIAIWVISPLYRVARSWPRAVAVAAVGSTPLALSGLFFVTPLLAAVGVIALPHCLYLYAVGLRVLCGCRTGDAAEFTAMVFLLSTALSGLIGAAAGAAGLL